MNRTSAACPLPDPAARGFVRGREYESSPDGGTTWDECTSGDVEKACSGPVFRALREGKILEVQSRRGIIYRRAKAGR